jgi:hypothetical protein
MMITQIYLSEISKICHLNHRMFKLIPELTAKVTKDNLNAMIRTIKVLKRIKIEDF